MPPASSRRLSPELKTRLKEVPSRPGVYLFHDQASAIIYIGKSVCLRDRVRSYFSGRPATSKLRRLRREICRIDWQLTGSELEALLLESRLVKQHLPRFNTLLRSFRASPYLRIDWEDAYPRLEITRKPSADGADYFGPFGSRDTLEAAVSVVADTLRLRTCEFPGDRLTGMRPCYRAEFGTCAAPCAATVGREEYRQTMQSAADLFAGRADSPLRVLEERMAAAAESLHFETAARLRDAIASVRRVSGRQQALVSAIRRLNLLAACPSVQEDAVALFLFASGRLALQKDVPRKSLERPAGRLRLARQVLQAHTAFPRPGPGPLPGILIDEIQIVSAWMRRRTAEGTYLPLPETAQAGETEQAVAAWLAGLAAGCGTGT